MFGIGFSELALIGLVLVIFIRPEDLPALFRKLGKIYGEIKRAYDELTKMKDDFIKDIEASASLDEPEKKEEAKDARQTEAGPPAAEAPATVDGQPSENGDPTPEEAPVPPIAAYPAPRIEIVQEKKDQ